MYQWLAVFISHNSRASILFMLCTCVSSWQNVVLETSLAVENSSVVVLTTLPGGCVSLMFSYSSSITRTYPLQTCNDKEHRKSNQIKHTSQSRWYHSTPVSVPGRKGLHSVAKGFQVEGSGCWSSAGIVVVVLAVM